MELHRSTEDRVHHLSAAFSFAEFFKNLEANASAWQQVVAEVPFAAANWELPALVADRLHQPFACVFVDNPTLAGVSAEPNTFAEHYDDRAAVHFTNLRGDSDLIAPTPRTGLEAAHLLEWARSATPAEADVLWGTVAAALHRRLTDAPTWLSTAGLGVYWLHVRLDPRPKYYRYGPYKAC